MKRFMHLIASILLGVGSVYAAEQNATSLTEVKVFRNVSGSTQTHGTAYILQEASTDTNIVIGATKGSDTTLGMDVTTGTGTDSDDFVGCQIDDSCADDALCRVAIWGPAVCRWNGGDNTNTRLADVGTSNVAGTLGSGTLAGSLLSLTLQAGVEDSEITSDGSNNQPRWIWVRPEGN